MPRPCNSRHDLSPGLCRYCYWCVSETTEGAAYRHQWGEPEPSTFPPLFRQAINYAMAKARHVAGGSEEVTERTSQRRLEVCQQCSSYRPEEKRCVECGCFVEIKSNWATSFCPLGKWAGLDELDETLHGTVIDPLGKLAAGDAKANWAQDWATREQHVQALNELIAAKKECPAGYAGEAIIYVGGGKYWPMIRLGIHKARKYTDLPIQVWHNSEHEPIPIEDLAGLGDVTIHDVLAVKPRPRRVGGWENKTTAILHSKVQKAIFLDADAYLVSPPNAISRLLSTERFVFWQDLPWNAQTVDWEWNGQINGTIVPSVQGGQLGINVVSFYPELVIAHFINQHSDYFYRHQYGDQDSWRIALTGTRGNYRNLGPAEWRWPAFVCRHAESIIVHRCQGKFWTGGNASFNAGLPDEQHTRRVHEDLFMPKGTASEVFASIYKAGVWGPAETSGGGSEHKEYAPYVKVVSVLRKLGGWDSAVDLGCGDGRVTEDLPFRKITGIDCYLPHLNRLKKERSDIQWIALDLDTEREGIPNADVALMRDVLHHWPNALVKDWIAWARKSKKWRHVVFSQDCHQQAEDEDCILGGYRALHPDLHPLAGLGLQEVCQYLHKAILLLDLT